MKRITPDILIVAAMFSCGCSTSYILPQHQPYKSVDIKGCAVGNASAEEQVVLRTGEECTLVFAGDMVAQPLGGCLDYHKKRIVSLASTYRMSRPGLVLYEKTVDALRRRGVRVQRQYLPQAQPSPVKQVYFKVEELCVYRVHKKQGDRIVANAAVSCGPEAAKDGSRLQLFADIPPESDVFEALAESLLDQLVR